jgi:hypothetical protein
MLSVKRRASICRGFKAGQVGWWMQIINFGRSWPAQPDQHRTPF